MNIFIPSKLWLYAYFVFPCPVVVLSSALNRISTFSTELWTVCNGTIFLKGKKNNISTYYHVKCVVIIVNIELLHQQLYKVKKMIKDACVCFWYLLKSNQNSFISWSSDFKYKNGSHFSMHLPSSGLCLDVLTFII
jgi:hypothetical protein